MTVPAWDVLAGLPVWQVAELPRRVPRGGDGNDGAAGLAARVTFTRAEWAMPYLVLPVPAGGEDR